MPIHLDVSGDGSSDEELFPWIHCQTLDGLEIVRTKSFTSKGSRKVVSYSADLVVRLEEVHLPLLSQVPDCDLPALARAHQLQVLGGEQQGGGARIVERETLDLTKELRKRRNRCVDLSCTSRYVLYYEK